jgi:hypothetical protein
MELLCLAKTLSAFVFNNLDECHSQATCDSTPLCYTSLGSFLTHLFAFSARDGAGTDDFLDHPTAILDIPRSGGRLDWK